MHYPPQSCEQLIDAKTLRLCNKVADLLYREDCDTSVIRLILARSLELAEDK